MSEFESAKKIFTKLVELCDEGIALEERKKNGENVGDEEDDSMARMAVQLIKLQ